jgi:hypothetical protein
MQCYLQKHGKPAVPLKPDEEVIHTKSALPCIYPPANAKHASTANPTLHPLISNVLIHSIPVQCIDLPPLLNPDHIINNIAIQLRKHTLQRLHNDFVFLKLDFKRFGSFQRCRFLALTLRIGMGGLWGS